MEDLWSHNHNHIIIYLLGFFIKLFLLSWVPDSMQLLSCVWNIQKFSLVSKLKRRYLQQPYRQYIFYDFEYLQRYECKFASNLHAIFFANFLSVCVQRESSDTKNQSLVHFYQGAFSKHFQFSSLFLHIFSQGNARRRSHFMFIFIGSTSEESK